MKSPTTSYLLLAAKYYIKYFLYLLKHALWQLKHGNKNKPVTQLKIGALFGTRKLKIDSLVNLLKIENWKLRIKSPRPLLLFTATLLLFLLPLTYFTLTKPPKAQAEWFNDNWSRRKKITIDADQVSGSADFTDFPVLVTETTDSDLSSHAQSDGDDIVFTDQNGKLLAHEIEYYSSGTLAAWVKVPTLLAAEDTVLYVYYGNPSAANSENPHSVWADYTAVWHFGEGSGTALADSSPGNNDATFDTGSNWTAPGTSKIGNAYDFQNNENASTNATFAPPTAGMLEFWFAPDLVDSDRPFGLDDGWEVRYDGTDGTMFTDLQRTGSHSNDTATTAWTAGTYYHIGIRYDGTNDEWEIYVNGSSDASGTDVSMDATQYNATFDIGDSRSLNNYFDGDIDEVRVHSAEQTDDWVTTSYNTQNHATSAFYTLGSQEVGTGPVGHWAFNEGVDNTCTDGADDACDSTSSTNDGLMTGGTWQAEDLCVNGKCMFFDGSDDVATITNADPIDFDVGLVSGVTFMGWIRANSNGESSVGEIFDKGSATFCRTDTESSGKADLQCSLDLATADATLNVSAALTINRWHHIAMGYTDDADDEITVYVDGIDVGSSTDGSGAPAGTDTNNLLIGGDTLANFHGSIDDFKVYPYERTTAQIAADALPGASGDGSSAIFADNHKFLSDGLVGYWKLDESSGNASDSSGNATTLTNVSTAAFSAAKFGNGAEPDGTADYFDAVDNTALSVTGSLTLSAWIEPDDVTGDEAIIGKFDDADESYLLMLTGDEIRIYIDSSSNYETTDAANLVADTKYHVLGVYDASSATVQIYVNGSLEASTTTGTIPSSIGDDAGEFTIGAEDSGGTAANFFNGHIDEARVYNRALSDREIRLLADFAPGPTGYWPLDENTGTSTTYDHSTNANNGTLTSITANEWVPGKFGSAINFDGSADIINISSDPDLEGFGQLSLSAWVYLTAGGQSAASRIISKTHSTSGDDDYSLGIQSNETLRFRITTSGGEVNCDSTEVLSLNTWYHVAGSYDGTTMIGYIDGSQACTASQSGTATDSNGDLVIGSHGNSPTNRRFTGPIDEARIYNYARTPGQIIEDMNAGHPLGGSPIGSQHIYFDFDEQNGQTTNNTGASTSISGVLGADSASSTDDPTWTTQANCKINGCLSFDGGDFITTASPNLPTGDFTYTAWVYPDSGGTNETILNAGDGTGGDEIMVRVNSTGNILVAVDGSFIINPTTNSINFDEWSHVAVTRSGNIVTAYLNGIADPTTGSDGDTLDFSTCELLIGVDADVTCTGSLGEYFNGNIDEVKVYNGALTASQVLIDMNTGAGINFSTGTDEKATAYGGPGGNDPVFYMPFDENTGTSSSSDKSGNDNPGTLNSITSNSWVSGKIGGALDLDGSADYINIDENSVFEPTSAISLSAWVYRHTSSTSDAVITKRRAGSEDSYQLRLETDSEIRFCLEPSGTNTCMNTTTTVTNNEWTHILATWDGTTMRVYINGILDPTTGSYTDSIEYGAFDLTIGIEDESGTISNYFDGIIDEVKIWNYTLDQAQVSYEFNRGAPIAHWELDACQGATAYDSSRDGNNDSNANTGTITIGATGDYTSEGSCGSGTAAEAWNAGSTGKFSSSLGFDGTDDSISITNATEIDIDSGALQNALTFSTWIYAHSDGETDVGRIFSKNTNTWCRADNESGNNLDLECSLDLATDATLNVSSALTLNTWHHLAMTWDNDSDDEFTLWVDGINVGSSTDGVGDPSADTSTLVIGGTPNFDGLIDDFRVYPYALSAAQLRKIINGGDLGSSASFRPNTGSP